MNMNVHEIADVLISSWLLSGDGKKIPTSHGLLDRALKKAVDKGALPDWARTKLHFVDSRIGLQCIELTSILEMAQRVNLTTAPNPSYRSTEIQVSEVVAKKLLKKHGISLDLAKGWGDTIRKEVETAKKALERFPEPMIEEY